MYCDSRSDSGNVYGLYTIILTMCVHKCGKSIKTFIFSPCGCQADAQSVLERVTFFVTVQIAFLTLLNYIIHIMFRLVYECV